MAPRRRSSVASGQRRQQPRAASKRSSGHGNDDAISVLSVEDSSPEPDASGNIKAIDKAAQPQRRSTRRASQSGKESARAVPIALTNGNHASGYQGRQRAGRAKLVKKEVLEDPQADEVPDEDDGILQPDTTTGNTNDAIEDTHGKSFEEEEAIESMMEEVDVEGASRNSAASVQANDVDEMELEEVDEQTSPNAGTYEDEEIDLEQVDVADSGADLEDTGAYAAAYAAARTNDKEGEPSEPIFKDGKGQPGGINISLSAAAQRSKASAASKRGPVITTRDRTIRLATHKVMALALLAHARVRNELLNDERLRDDLYAVVPNGFLEKLRAIHPKKAPNQNERVRLFEALMRELTKWWSYKFRLEPQLTALGALRQPDTDLLAGQFPKPGRRVDGWIVESARERQGRQREMRRRDEERRKAREARNNAQQDLAESSMARSRRKRHRAVRVTETNGETAQTRPQPPFPDITLFGIGNSTTPVYMHLAEPRECTRTIADLLDYVYEMKGSREISAQLFAALCRSLGIPSRLVISLQVPSWSIAAGKVAATAGAVQTPSKGGSLAKKRRAHHEEHATRRDQQNAVRRQNDLDIMTSDAESFKADTDGNTSDEFHGTLHKFRRRDGDASRSSVSRPVSIASTTPAQSDAESAAKAEIGRRSGRRRPQGKPANEAGRFVGGSVTLQAEETGNVKKDDKDGDYRAEKWRGLDKPLKVEYIPKLRAQKPKALKESELAADTQPDIPPVDVLAPPTMWVEVFSKPWQRWITIDPVRGLVEPTGNRQMEPATNDRSNRLVYVVAFEEDGYARDVTARYTRTLHSRVSRMRPPPSKRNASGDSIDWWSRVVASLHRPQRLDRDAAEDLELEGAASREPMPTSVAAFKDHPVYALEKHLKRDEVIYPYRQAGTFQGMPVFLRSNVVGVKSARQWYNEGRVVKDGEEALKWVKSRGYTLANKRAEEEARQQGLDGLQEGLYALFQTQLYQAPPVVDGIVPTNSFGNIDLFVESMLPPGGAHIPHNGAAKVAKQLGVPFAEAITGFEFRKHRSMPRLSGIVVAEEAQEAVLEAFWASEHMQVERELQKRQERLFKNWKKLLNALKIQERVQREYGAAKTALAGESTESANVNDESKRGKKRARRKGKENTEEQHDDDDLRAYHEMHAAGYDENEAEEAEAGGFLIE